MEEEDVDYCIDLEKILLGYEQWYYGKIGPFFSKNFVNNYFR